MTTRGGPGITSVDYLYAKASRLKVPLHGTFELSPVCNFKCKMCYVRKTPEEVKASPRKIMELEDWRRIARQAHKKGTLFLLLTGGEPLLWPDFWTLYEELVDMGFLVSINTNGSMIDEKAILRFRNRPPYKINITLYGAGPESYDKLCCAKGAYEKVDAAIRSLTEAGIRLKLNCSLTPSNADDMEGIINYAKSKQIPLALTTYMLPPVRRDPAMIGRNERFTPEQAADYMMQYMKLDRGAEVYQKYLEKILKGTAHPPGLDEDCFDPKTGNILCKAGSSSFWVTWDGWMTPCAMMPEPKADLAHMDFRDAWQSIAEQISKLKLSGICSQCPDKKFCRPCAAIAYCETGSVSEVPKYLCQMSQEIYRIAKNSQVFEEE